jgi:DNA-binding CsgD family transcriptional regulator
MVLEGLLSLPAEELYSRLLNDGVIRINGTTEFAADSSVVHELVDKHFASWTIDGGGLVAVAPRLAIESALLAEERGIVRAHEACMNALTAMPTLQEAYEKSAGREGGDQRVRIISHEDAARLSVDLLATARYQVLAFVTASACTPGLPTDPARSEAVVARLRSRGVQVRCIFAKEFLELPRARDAVAYYGEQGFEIRAIHDLPTTMIMVDSRAAMVPLDTGAATGAVMFRHGAATNLLQAAFELHWGRSVPLVAGGASGNGVPSDMQLLILRLLAAGMKDESIARHLGVSLRTVRRNLTTLCEAVGAPTRFTLATFAAEHGWVAPSATTTIAHRDNDSWRSA